MTATLLTLRSMMQLAVALMKLCTLLKEQPPQRLRIKKAEEWRHRMWPLIILSQRTNLPSMVKRILTAMPIAMRINYPQHLMAWP